MCMGFGVENIILLNKAKIHYHNAESFIYSMQMSLCTKKQQKVQNLENIRKNLQNLLNTKITPKSVGVNKFCGDLHLQNP